jgi:hypothetical protein
VNSVETTHLTSSKSNKFIQHIPGRIHEVQDVLTKDECLRLIQEDEKSGFNPSPPSGDGHGQTERTGAI